MRLFLDFSDSPKSYILFIVFLASPSLLNGFGIPYDHDERFRTFMRYLKSLHDIIQNLQRILDFGQAAEPPNFWIEF